MQKKGNNKKEQKQKLIDLAKLPENYHFFNDPILAIKYYIKDLLYYSNAEHEIQLILGSKLDLSFDYIKTLIDEVYEELELRSKKIRVLESDKNKFADLIQIGLKKTLEAEDYRSYFRGVELFGLLCGFTRGQIKETKETVQEVIPSALLDKIKEEPKLPGE